MTERKPTSKKATKKSTRKKSSKKRASKKTAKKTTKKAEPKPAPLNEETIARVVDMLVLRAMNDDQVRAKMRTPRVEEYLVEARTRIANASSFDRATEIAAGVARMKAVYRFAYKVGKLAEAVSAQTQIAKLLALYPKEAGDGINSPTDGAGRGELAQIEAHLRPLGLGPDDYPVVELARIAAAKIAETMGEEDAPS
jgi:hypothetical protein